MPPPSELVEIHAGCDQARELRAMVSSRNASLHRPDASPGCGCRSLTVISGKGGVGKSVVALNLAVALKRLGKDAALLDASPGTGSLSLLCGQTGYWNLEHVVAGTRELADVVLTGLTGIQILPGASHVLACGERRVLRELVEFEDRQDWLIVDTGSDVSQARRFAAATDRTLIVTTPEPTSVAEAYAALKLLSATGVSAVSVIVNQANSRAQAMQVLNRLRQAARTFVGSDTGLAGIIPWDAAVGQSVYRRQPLGDMESAGSVLGSFDEAAARLDQAVVRQNRAAFFQRVVD